MWNNAEVKKRFDIDEYIEKTDKQYMYEKTSSPEKWRWKLRMVNYGGMTYFVVFTVLAFCVGIFLTLPEIYAKDAHSLWQRKMAACYIIALTYANYFFMVRSFKKSKFGKGTEYLPSNMTNWTHCRSCDLMVPPRAKHCVLCECCILKRDHHCFFAGCCIGFHNQRYFTVFCFYGCLGSIYSLYTIYIYLDKYYTPLFSLDFYGYLLPWLLWRWFWGVAHHSIIWLTVLLYMSCASSFACTYFFAWQIYLVFTGQTTYEFLKKDKTFKRPLLENLKSTFGNLSLLNFVCPLPFFKNHGNGIEWRTTCGLEEKIC